MKAECEFCGEVRNVNKHFVCKECWKAQDSSPIYTFDMRDEKLSKVISASYALKDIIPYAEKGMDDESIEQTSKFYSGIREWKK